MRQLHVIRRSFGPFAWALTTIPLGGCGGIQSTLDPAGTESTRIAHLFWLMTGGAVLVWCGVLVLAIYCGRPAGRRFFGSRGTLLIVGGGVVIPTLVLGALLAYGLWMLPPLVARAPEGSLQVSLVGEQWWWRVRYERSDGEPVELANEIRLPVNERVQFRLESDNVIHSFWVPALGGKMDMIPGRITYLSLHPTTTGVFRGVCAEYCGASHARMAFYVEVMERTAFDEWLQRQAAPARSLVEPDAIRGQELFLANGCSACHRISGTPASGRIGPDLTHVASRRSVAAGVLPNDRDALRQWLADTTRIKPGAHMPRFGMLPQDDLGAIAAYLRALE
jgi:cytochrome c oxidase subunit 2